MTEKQKELDNLKDSNRLVPQDNQQIAESNEQFRKEKEDLLRQLEHAKSKHNRQSEIEILEKLRDLYSEHRDLYYKYGYLDEALAHGKQASEYGRQVMKFALLMGQVFADRFESWGKSKEAKEVFEEILRITRTSCPEEKEKIKWLEQKIQRQEAELLRSRQMATLGVMASGLAHEITQPLQLILAVAQNCIRDIQSKAIDTEGTLADLDRIATTTKRIDKIVNHLHVLSRERGPQLEAVNVNTVIENSFIMFHQQLKTRGIQIERNFSDDLPPVKADTVQLEQVFINLINNARNALEEVEDKTIIISTQAQNSQVQVRVQDNGKGIDPADLPQIFDAFFTRREDGMGLGLYITQDIIHSYGGTITAHSSISKGTTFLIQLPVAEEEETE